MRAWLIAAATVCAAQEIPAISRAIETAIAQKQIPGAVCLIGQGDRVVHRRAYGVRSLERSGEAMTLDTIFDAASLTKVVVTTTAVMQMAEAGKIDIDAPVSQYLPDYGYRSITVRHLLTHYSGLRPDVDLEPEWSGYQEGIRRALVDKPQSAPGEKFVYSDINFLLLGEIVRRISGVSLDEYARREIFIPLGMSESTYNPPAAWRDRIAPTERLKAEAASLRGVVHDPTARFMGGVAGHAGMFTTADDLAKFARWMLAASPAKLRFTSVQTAKGAKAARGLGWDIDSPYAAPRGDLLPVEGGFGHTGFTGTSLWIDRESGTYLILLANSVHPMRRPAIAPLRREIGTLAARELTAVRTMTGLDVWIADGFAALKGKRVGLITNHTGLARDGRRNIDAMRAAGVDLRALFSPEHGIAGKEDHENVANAKDAATGLTVYSLYQGKQRRPSEESLREVDVLVFDIQDIGARFYTYLSTMVNAMEEAARRKLPFYVLDRPNPITGLHVEGPPLDAELVSFIGIRSGLPVRHGMTLGELAKMINASLSPKADLTVVAMKQWSRRLWWDETHLAWVNPSPNMKTLTGALLYPGLALLEFNKNYSVGRGTGTPFERIGADWMNAEAVAASLNRRGIPGIRAYPLRENAVQFVVTDRDAVDASRFGLEVAAVLRQLYPDRIDIESCAKLIGNRAVMEALKSGAPVPAWDLRPFLAEREKHLLYR